MTPESLSPDPYQLQRFVSAQGGIYETALEELNRGAKRSHWMWFIFPQFAGLGSSAMAARYAIRSKPEAQAYLAHPLLGPRLLECTHSLLQVTGKTAEQIMGYPDYLKLCSSMTLFAAISPAGSPFHLVLERYYSGVRDEKTIAYLAERESESARP